MTKNLDSDGLSSIVHNYDLFYIDLWGVVHNGINLYEGAISTLKKLKKNNKDFCRIVISSLKNTLSFFICLMEKLKGDINSNY